MLPHQVATALLMTRSDAALARRYGFALAWRRGVACFTRRRAFPYAAFGSAAIGFGVRAAPTGDVLEAVARHYASRGLVARVVVVAGLVPRGLLERHGFRRAHEDSPHVTYLHRAARAPRAPEVPGLTLERVSGSEIGAFVELARDAFEDRGEVRAYFARAQRAALRRHPRSAIPIRARIDGVPAGTGVLYLARGVASLGSGAVLPRFRGRGIHPALIAARIALGLARGYRLFLSGAATPASARNLADAGFRPYYRASVWEREP